MQIKILGSGCNNCDTLEKNVKEAISRLGINAEILKVTDFKDMMAYGILSTPSMVINEKVVVHGKVLKPDELIKVIEKEKERDEREKI